LSLSSFKRNGEPLDFESLSLRRRIAREAANLLYSGVEKEYKQAKLKAAKAFGANFLPTNLEVAMELDRAAEENEGPARHDRLVAMRREALALMEILKEYNPVLIGSVWRGTIHHGSDIDIVVYHDQPEEVLKILRRNSVKVTLAEQVAVTKKGSRKGSFHIHAESLAGEEVEIKVCSPEEAEVRVKCEIYGDQVVGLRTEEVRRVLGQNPVQRFVPF
jgi:predicted nucleotidyltransferase